MINPGKLIILMGVVIIIIGLFITVIGKLPGDISFKKRECFFLLSNHDIYNS